MSKLILFLSFVILMLTVFLVSIGKKAENFQLTPVLSKDKILSFKSHENALKNYCDLKNLKSKSTPISAKPWLQEITCEIPTAEMCAEYDIKTKDTPFGFKWVKVPTRIYNEEMRNKLGEENLFELRELLSQYKKLKEDRQNAHIKVTNDCFLEQKYVETIDGEDIWKVSINVGTTNCNAMPKYKDRHEAVKQDYLTKVRELDGKVKTLVVQNVDAAFALDDPAIWLNLDPALTDATILDKVKSGELKNRDRSSLAPIVDTTTFGPLYIDTGMQEMCVKHFRFMENFCRDMQPCDDTINNPNPEQQKTCSKSKNYFMFTLGNPVCYIDEGYCEPLKQEDNQTLNCVMKKEYCDYMGLDYYPAEKVTTVCNDKNNPTKCLGVMNRGGCGFSDAQAFIENMPLGTTITRKFKQAGLEAQQKCAEDGVLSQSCAGAIGGILATPGIIIGDTATAYFAQTFDKFQDAWKTAFNNPSPESLIALFDTVNLIPGVYVQSKMGEMLDAAISQIPKVGDIFGGQGMVEFFMTYAALAGINPAIAAFWAGKKAIPLLISYYYFYGPEYADKARNWIINNPGSNWIVNAYETVEDFFSDTWNKVEDVFT